MKKTLVMVVDDEKAVADEISAAISETGRYEVITTYSAKEALEQLSKNRILWGLGGNRIKLIVLDIKMPEMDGLQFLEKIRSEFGYAGKELGVIILTAYEDKEKWDRATSGFVINYLAKPYKPQELISTIDRFFAGEEPNLVIETFEKHLERKKKGFEKS